MEDEVRGLIAADVAPYADERHTDRSGNLIAFKKGRKPRTEKSSSAHMDEVGFMVTHISEDGFAYFGTIGGIDPRVVAGKRVVLGDKRLPGVIAAKAIHMQKPEERGVPAPVDEMFIDIGCISEENTKALVSVGDCAVFAPNYEAFGDGFIKSKAIDDRFGCAVLVKLLESQLEYDTYFAFCTAEEVGCRGAATVGQAIGAGTVIVLEATTAGDIPGAPKSRVACRVGAGAVVSFMDGGTVYPRELIELAMATAGEKGIRAQLKELVAGGNDASAYQRAAAVRACWRCPRPCATSTPPVQSPKSTTSNRFTHLQTHLPKGALTNEGSDEEISEYLFRLGQRLACLPKKSQTTCVRLRTAWTQIRWAT